MNCIDYFSSFLRMVRDAFSVSVSIQNIITGDVSNLQLF